jgi:hypothetical protein
MQLPAHSSPQASASFKSAIRTLDLSPFPATPIRLPRLARTPFRSFLDGVFAFLIGIFFRRPAGAFSIYLAIFLIFSCAFLSRRLPATVKSTHTRACIIHMLSLDACMYSSTRLFILQSSCRWNDEHAHAYLVLLVHAFNSPQAHLSFILMRAKLRNSKYSNG